MVPVFGIRFAGFAHSKVTASTAVLHTANLRRRTSSAPDGAPLVARVLPGPLYRFEPADQMQRMSFVSNAALAGG